eukprot:1730576-Prymnesium_polylepis.1
MPAATPWRSGRPAPPASAGRARLVRTVPTPGAAAARCRTVARSLSSSRARRCSPAAPVSGPPTARRRRPPAPARRGRPPSPRWAARRSPRAATTAC